MFHWSARPHITYFLFFLPSSSPLESASSPALPVCCTGARRGRRQQRLWVRQERSGAARRRRSTSRSFLTSTTLSHPVLQRCWRRRRRRTVWHGAQVAPLRQREKSRPVERLRRRSDFLHTINALAPSSRARALDAPRTRVARGPLVVVRHAAPPAASPADAAAARAERRHNYGNYGLRDNGKCMRKWPFCDRWRRASAMCTHSPSWRRPLPLTRPLLPSPPPLASFPPRPHHTAAMGRMYAPGKGISRSSKPYVRTAPSVSQGDARGGRGSVARRSDGRAHSERPRAAMASCDRTHGRCATRTVARGG